jgi:hypothetical protein
MKAVAIVELEKPEVLEAIQKLAKEKLPKALQDSFQGSSKVEFTAEPSADGTSVPVNSAKVIFNLK